MRKKIESFVYVQNKQITKIQEKLVNTGSHVLTREPRTNQFSKDMIDLLKKHNLIDTEDDVVHFWVQVQS